MCSNAHGGGSRADGEATRHFNAKVQPALFEAAARRVGSQSSAVVIEAALAGRVACGIAGAARAIRTAFDRVERIHDALTALAALRAGATIVTRDRDFDPFMQLEPELEVVFYE